MKTDEADKDGGVEGIGPGRFTAGGRTRNSAHCRNGVVIDKYDFLYRNLFVNNDNT